MSVNLYFVALALDTDPEFQKHKKVLDVCMEAGVSIPEETCKYFNYDGDLGYEGLANEKLEIPLQEDVHYKEFYEGDLLKHEIDLTTLPEGVKRIQFYLA